MIKTEEYVTASMDAQIQLSNDFCGACRSQCSSRSDGSIGNEQNATNSHYWFAWQGDESLIFNSGAETDPVRYDCEACLQECDRIKTDIQAIRQEEHLSSCSAISWPDGDNSREQTYYAGLHCMQERSFTMLRLAVYSNRSSCEANDNDADIVDVLDDIGSYYGDTAHKMWWNVMGQYALALACLRNAENIPEPSDSTASSSNVSANWCQEFMNLDSVIPCTSIVDDITADSMLQDFCNQALALELRRESTPYIGRIIFDLPIVTPPTPPVTASPPTVSPVTAPPLLLDEEATLEQEDTIYDFSGNSLQLQQCLLRTELQSSSGGDSSWTSTARQRQDDPSTSISSQREPPTASYVLFQLCIQPHNASSVDTCSSCQDYVVDLETYLRFTTDHIRSLSLTSCSNCKAQCSGTDAVGSESTVDTTRTMICDDCWKHTATSNEELLVAGSYCWYTSENDDAWYLYSGFTTTSSANSKYQMLPVSCDVCLPFCQRIENTEQNGYLDATLFNQCQMIYYPENLDTEEILYAGPYCHDDETVKIGVFTDELCQYLDPSKNVDDYLVNADGFQMRLAYNTLMGATETDLSYSCQVSYNGHRVELNEMCEQLYSQSVPCGDEEAIPPLAIARQGASDRFDESTLQYMKSLCPGSNSSFVEFIGTNQNNGNNNADSSEEVNSDASSSVLPEREIDISGSSLQFQRCIQFESEVIDDYQQATNGTTMPWNTGYVVFQMCRDAYGKDTCSGCQDYVIELSNYLEYTSRLAIGSAQDACDKCYAGCTDSTAATSNSKTGATATKICDDCLLTGDSPGSEEDEKFCWTMSQEDPNWYLYQGFVSTNSRDTDTPAYSCEDCHGFCKDLYPMENGFVDAIMFSGCELVYDPEDDGQSQFYAGAYCSKENEVKIGVFTDQYCQVLTPVLDVHDYLFDDDGFQMQLTYQFLNPLLKQHQSLSCTETQPESDMSDTNIRYCQWLHDNAVPCETETIFPFAVVDRDDATVQYMKALCPRISTIDADETSVGDSGTNGVDNAPSSSSAALACSARNYTVLFLRGLLMGYLLMIAV